MQSRSQTATSIRQTWGSSEKKPGSRPAACHAVSQWLSVMEGRITEDADSSGDVQSKADLGAYTGAPGVKFLNFPNVIRWLR